jgi:hypothetical protein
MVAIKVVSIYTSEIIMTITNLFWITSKIKMLHYAASININFRKDSLGSQTPQNTKCESLVCRMNLICFTQIKDITAYLIHC